MTSRNLIYRSCSLKPLAPKETVSEVKSFVAKIADAVASTVRSIICAFFPVASSPLNVTICTGGNTSVNLTQTGTPSMENFSADISGMNGTYIAEPASYEPSIYGSHTWSVTLQSVVSFPNLTSLIVTGTVMGYSMYLSGM